MWNWIVEHSDFLGFGLGLVTLMGSAFQYFLIRRADERKRRFETYHELIRKLVEREDNDKPKMLDRQLAVAFELRNFPEYSEPSLRILTGLRNAWSSGYGPDDKNNRLLAQLDSTVYFLTVRSKNKLYPPI